MCYELSSILFSRSHVTPRGKESRTITVAGCSTSHFPVTTRMPWPTTGPERASRACVTSLHGPLDRVTIDVCGGPRAEPRPTSCAGGREKYPIRAVGGRSAQLVAAECKCNEPKEQNPPARALHGRALALARTAARPRRLGAGARRSSCLIRSASAAAPARSH